MDEQSPSYGIASRRNGVTQHPVLLLIIGLSAVGVGLFGWWMSRLKRQFAKEDERFRRVSGNG